MSDDYTPTYDPENHDDRAEFLLDYTDLSRRDRDAMLAATRDCDSDWATVLEDPDADCGPSLQAWSRLLAAVENTYND